MTFEMLHSETVFRGRAFDVRQDQICLPDGNQTQLDIVAHVGAVTVLPLDQDGRVWFVRQYRHAAGEELLELPAGTLEPGEAPELAAGRELREETGFAAGKLRKLGVFFLAPGYSTEIMHVFLATDLSVDPLPKDADEFLTVEPIPLESALVMAADGRIRDSKSLVGLFFLRLHQTTPPYGYNPG